MATNLTSGDDFFLDPSIFFKDSEINGRGGNDTIFGEDGDDTLHGNTGNDTLFGQTDNDVLFGDAGSDLLLGGNGSDRLLGGSENDALFGNEGNDSLSGEGGDDALAGGDGSDTLSGGEGNDKLTDGADGSNDSLSGGTGDDTFVWSLADVDFAPESDNINGGTGNDSVEVNGIGAGEEINLSVGSGGRQTTFLEASFNAGSPPGGGLVHPSLAIANVQALNVRGQDGDDRMVIENLGSTPLGTISFEGGDGNDVLQFPSDAAGAFLQEIVFDAGNGNDSFIATGLAATRLVAFGRAGTDLFEGGSADDEFHGGPDRDLSVSGSGNDELHGDEGDDVFGGGPGNDRLFGEQGGDRLVGGEGDDELTGGEGGDVFVYEALPDLGAGNRDTILDFGPGDRIELSGVAATDVDINGDQVINDQDSPVVSLVGGNLRMAFGDNILTAVGVSQLTPNVDVFFLS